MKAWITHYVLNRGIIETEAKVLSDEIIEAEDGERFYSGEWYDTKEKAIMAANLKINAEIKRLENRLKRLKKIKF
jgi:hypothetical protein